ncbi:hypothetical protein Tco_0919345 [Tanacetum coccineum]
MHAGIQPASPKAVQYQQGSLSRQCALGLIHPETDLYVEDDQTGRPESITPAYRDAQIAFWNDPGNQVRACSKIAKTEQRALSFASGIPITCSRFEMEMMAMLRDSRVPQEMGEAAGSRSPTSSRVYLHRGRDQCHVQKGKHGHLPVVCRVLPDGARDVLIPPRSAPSSKARTTPSIVEKLK